MILNELTTALFGIALVLAGIGLAVAGILEWSARSLWLALGDILSRNRKPRPPREPKTRTVPDDPSQTGTAR